MRLQYKRNIFFVVCQYFTIVVFAQQEAQYTQYMYNPTSINPAYAGSRDVFSFTGLYRSQWIGLDGAPKTMTASFHTPVGEKVGLGLNFTNDQVFISQQTYIDVDFSYSIALSYNSRLAFGLKGGIDYLDIDSGRAVNGPRDSSDTNALFAEKKLSPQIGFGFFYYTDKFYLGLSAPYLLETEYFDVSNESDSRIVTKRVSYYLFTGYVWGLSQDIKFKPSVMAKAVFGAPLQVDVSANFLINDRLTLGAAYRWDAAFSALAAFQISNQIMLGIAYDRETTQLAQFNNGSLEFLFRFDLIKKHGRVLSPRFF